MYHCIQNWQNNNVFEYLSLSIYELLALLSCLPETQCVPKSTIDVTKYSNTIQLSPNMLINTSWLTMVKTEINSARVKYVAQIKRRDFSITYLRYCTKSGSLRFSQFSGCWLILSVYIIMSFDFPFVRLFGVR